MQNILMIIIALCGLGFLILVHEFGHFIVAKIFGIKVEVFSIGFGPALLKFKGGETEYRVSLFFLLGGYVKLYGEISKEAEDVGQDARAMVNRPWWQQVLVVFAGVFMNFIFGILFCVVVFLVGLNMSAPVIGDISTDGIEFNTPLTTGDRIVSVNDKPVRYLEEYLMLVMTETKPLKIRARDRNNNEYEFKVLEARGKSGVSRYYKAVIDDILPGSIMEKWGFKKNDVILKVNGFSIKTWQEFINYLTANYEKEITVTICRKLNQSIQDCSTESGNIENLKFSVKPDTVLFGFDNRKFMSNTVCGVKKYSMAENIGINKNDRIVAINGKRTQNWAELNNILWDERLKEELEFHIQDISGNVRVSKIKNTNPVHGKPIVGITPCVDELNTDTFNEIPVQLALSGISKGDKLLEVEGEKVKRIAQLLKVVSDKEKDIHIKFQTAKGEIKETRLKLEKLHLINDGILGAVPKIDTITIKYPFLEAMVRGYKQALEFIRLTYLSVYLLIKKQVSPQDIAGPVGIIHISAKVIQRGVVDFLYLLALISLNLAVLNLLPIPVLDGSVILLFTVEKLIGRKLPERLLKIFEITGYCLLLGLLLFALKNDIFRIIKQG